MKITKNDLIILWRKKKLYYIFIKINGFDILLQINIFMI